MNETKINELTNQISKMRAILNDLTAQLEAEKNKVEEKKEPSIEDRWKPNKEDTYFAMNGIEYDCMKWADDMSDDLFYDSYNTWKTKARAEEVSNKTKLFWLMEQIHDILCPDYKPNWEDDSETKRSICFDCSCNKWVINRYSYYSIHKMFTFFDTREHAEQACKILNDMGIKPI